MAFARIGKVIGKGLKGLIRKIKPAGVTRGGMKSAPKGFSPQSRITSGGKRFGTSLTKKSGKVIPRAEKGVTSVFKRKVITGSLIGAGVGGTLFGASKLLKNIRTDFIKGKSSNVQAELDMGLLERVTQTGEDFDNLSAEGKDFVSSAIEEGRGSKIGMLLLIAGLGAGAFFLFKKKKRGKKK